MKIGEMFSTKLKRIEQEIRAFKTAHFKTSTTLAVMSKNSSVAFDLILIGNPGGYAEMWSGRIAVITLTTEDDTNMLSALYIKNLTADNNRRFVFCTRVAAEPHQAKFEITVNSQNGDDYQTLVAGGTVYLEYQIEGVGTSRFNINVEYIPQRVHF